MLRDSNDLLVRFKGKKTAINLVLHCPKYSQTRKPMDLLQSDLTEPVLIAIKRLKSAYVKYCGISQRIK